MSGKGLYWECAWGYEARKLQPRMPLWLNPWIFHNRENSCSVPLAYYKKNWTFCPNFFYKYVGKGTRTLKVLPTWTWIMRVYQFRHPDNLNNNTILLYYKKYILVNYQLRGGEKTVYIVYNMKKSSGVYYNEESIFILTGIFCNQPDLL